MRRARRARVCVALLQLLRGLLRTMLQFAPRRLTSVMFCVALVSASVDEPGDKQIHALARLLDAIDADEDSHVTRQEIVRYLHTHHAPRYRAQVPEVERTFRENVERDIQYLDKNGDHKLSLTELKPETQRSIDFAAVDKDANGVLDADELVATLTHDLPHSLMHEHAGELLELVDNNGDERASHEEILLNHRDFVDGLLTGSHGEL